MTSTDADTILYCEALECLTLAAEQCEKPSGVDITVILESCRKCRDLVGRLILSESNVKRLDGLQQLRTILDYHQRVLDAKLTQLNARDESSTETPNKETSPESGKQQRTHRVEGTIIAKGQVCFNDVVGLEEAKQSLREAIILPLLHPQLFTGGRTPWRRILLYGPPGTGKSRLAQAVASEIQSTFYAVSSADLLSSWVGESEKLIKELFVHASKQEGKSVIFIDEVDSICRQRSSREEEHTRRLKTELLTQMEGISSSASESSEIFLLCATNCPWELDSAFLRRFQKRIYIPLPEREARLQLIKMHCGEEHSSSLADEDWEELAQQTRGYSGSDIANMVLGALYEPIRQMQQATHWLYSSDGHLIPCEESSPGAMKASMATLPPHKVRPRDLCLEDFITSLSRHSHTVTKEELEKFNKFTETFGQKG